MSKCLQTLLLTFDVYEVELPMYRVSEGVHTTHGQDGAIVLDIGRGKMFNLNVVASGILDLITRGASQPEIVDQIVRKFGVCRDRAENDVQEFLKTLKKHRLIESGGNT